MAVTTTAGASLNDRVAAEIRAELGRQQLSGRKLADQLGVSNAWVSYRLGGQQAIDLEDLEKIAAVLDVPIHHLLPPAADGDLGGTRHLAGGAR